MHGNLRRFATLFVLFIAAPPVAAQTPRVPLADSATLTHNKQGPAELAQFDFLVGTWDVAVTMPQGTAEPRISTAQWHNRWVANGYVMMQEWRSVEGGGIELRSFNPVTRKWDGRNVYAPEPGTWYENEAEQIGTEMVVTTRATLENGGQRYTREVYHAISVNRFEIRTEVSRDGGKTWTVGRYHMVATRRASPNTREWL